MRITVSFYIDEDLCVRLRDIANASKITKRQYKINEILEEVLPQALDDWEKKHENISLIRNNRKYLI